MSDVMNSEVLINLEICDVEVTTNTLITDNNLNISVEVLDPTIEIYNIADTFRMTSGIPISLVVSNRFTADVSMFGDFGSNRFSMGNRTNMPNGYVTKCNPSYNNERRLFDKVISESIKQHGVCLDYYVTSHDVSYDKVWGEDNNRRMIRKFQFNGFYTLPIEEKVWGKFGITGMDTFSMFVSKLHFEGVSKYNFDRTVRQYESYVPMVGDLIRADYNKYIYEITEVKEETSMFLLSKQHVWEFVVKPFKDEKISIDVGDVTMEEIRPYTDKDSDIFDVTDKIDEKKTDVLYIPKPTEKPSGDVLGGW